MLGRVRKLAVLWAIPIWLVAAPGHARPEYPGEVQAATGTECPPPCLMCHKLVEGGKNWNAFGLRVYPWSLAHKPWPEILAGLKNPDVDTDGDGRLDISEVEAGTNPAQAGNDVIVCPKYGCGARISAGESSHPLGAVLALAAVFALGYLRRGHRRAAR
jgi:hypothetical protein